MNNALQSRVDARVDEYRALQEARWEALLSAFWVAATEELDVRAARVVQRVLQALDSLWGLYGMGARGRATEPAKPWGLVMFGSYDEWVSAGSPRD